MIVLDRTPALLIRQPDHAAAAAVIMRHWMAGGLPESPRRDDILLAVEEHDNGWREIDTEPLLDEATGRILDFVNVPVAVRQGVWTRGVARLAPTPYAAALVAQHALNVYRRLREVPEWEPFFGRMAAARDAHLTAAGVALDDLRRDYVFLRLADLSSLTFCGVDVSGQSDEFGCTMRKDGSRLVVTPDPFAGAVVALEVPAREISATVFSSRTEVQRAWAAAPVRTIAGVAAGGAQSIPTTTSV